MLHIDTQYRVSTLYVELRLIRETDSYLEFLIGLSCPSPLHQVISTVGTPPIWQVKVIQDPTAPVVSSTGIIITGEPEDKDCEIYQIREESESIYQILRVGKNQNLE